MNFHSLIMTMFLLCVCFLKFAVSNQCNSNIVFIWENSFLALSKKDFENLKYFTNQISIKLANEKTTFSLIHHDGKFKFSKNYKTIGTFSEIKVFEKYVKSIKLIHNFDNSVFLSQALEQSYEIFKKTPSKDSNVVLIISNGFSSTKKPNLWTDLIHVKRIQNEFPNSLILAIGVGSNIDEKYLRSISDFYFRAGSYYNSLSLSFIDQVTKKTCPLDLSYKRYKSCPGAPIIFEIFIPNDELLSSSIKGEVVCVFKSVEFPHDDYVKSIWEDYKTYERCCMLPQNAKIFKTSKSIKVYISYNSGKRQFLAKEIHHYDKHYCGGDGISSSSKFGIVNNLKKSVFDHLNSFSIQSLINVGGIVGGIILLLIGFVIILTLIGVIIGSFFLFK